MPARDKPARSEEEKNRSRASRFAGKAQSLAFSPLRRFLETEASGGVALLAATVLALAWANGPLAGAYEDLWHKKLTVGFGTWAIREDLRHWVNDALMTVFFFLIGLEIKRERLTGELQSARAFALPGIAAVGGMVAPALIYLALAGGGEASRGWGIPMATDIAFAVGVLTVIGRRVPNGLKIFLLTLAIIDDIGAITVIALFYSAGVEISWLLAAAACLGAVVALRLGRVGRPLAYVPVGILAWYCTLRAGIHPTIAGVALGLLTPAVPVAGRNVLQDLEHRLHPWSSYMIVPLFALANAGVHLGGGALQKALASRLTWAVAAGLLVGKIVGITSATWASLRLRLGTLPGAVRMGHVVGIGALGGIGFTVSLFIAALAFPTEALQSEAKIGILLGSVAAALAGSVILLAQTDPAPGSDDDPATLDEGG